MSEANSSPPPRRARLALFLPLAIFLALAMVFLARLLQGGDPSVIPSALVGKPVPEFELPPLAGLTRDGAPVPGLSDEDLAQGEVNVVNVWASWCGPCRLEHPLLMELAERGHRVVGINYKDEAENGRRFLGSLGNPYEAVGVDDDGRSAIDWGVYGVPETFVVDGEGVIRFKHVGPLTQEVVEGRLMPAIEAAAVGNRS
jgi:cytochrome c biogenesis protein CcmG/thiol:disulfide interchange protein DsbE